MFLGLIVVVYHVLHLLFGKVASIFHDLEHMFIELLFISVELSDSVLQFDFILDDVSKQVLQFLRVYFLSLLDHLLCFLLVLAADPDISAYAPQVLNLLISIVYGFLVGLARLHEDVIQGFSSLSTLLFV